MLHRFIQYNLDSEYRTSVPIQMKQTKAFEILVQMTHSLVGDEPSLLAWLLRHTLRPKQHFSTKWAHQNMYFFVIFSKLSSSMEWNWIIHYSIVRIGIQATMNNGFSFWKVVHLSVRFEYLHSHIRSSTKRSTFRSNVTLPILTDIRTLFWFCLSHWYQ